MANVTTPPILDTTGIDITTQLEEIAQATQVSPSQATSSTPGLVKVDGTTISIDTNGVISAPNQGSTLVPIPTVTGTAYTYNGSQQQPTITGVDTSHVDVFGTLYATNAGTYTITFALKDAHTTAWSDKSTANKTVTWVINKALGQISLSPASVILNNTTTSQTLTVNVTGDGTVSFTSSDSSIAVASPSSLSGSGTIQIVGVATGSATITATLGEGTNYSGGATATVGVEVNFVPLKTFSAATDAEIAQMVAASDAGLIDLYEDCGWRVGQEHQISLSSITTSGTYDGVSWGVGESHSAQTVTLVLMHQGLYTLVTPVKDKNGNNRSTCSFVVGLKNCLSTKGYMNYISTNRGSWNDSARRNWCNGGFRQAIPEVLRSSFKQFNCVTAQAYNSSSTYTSQDYFALPAAAEVFKGDPNYGTGGTAGYKTAYSTLAEFNALTRFTWYATDVNRIKYQGTTSNAYDWYQRSPAVNTSFGFDVTNVLGDAGGGIYAATQLGISPFGVL